MSEIYLDSEMLQQLNSTVQLHFIEWLKAQHFDIRNPSHIVAQHLHDQSTIMTLITTISTCFILYVFYKLIIANPYNKFIKPVKFEIGIPVPIASNWKSKRVTSKSIKDPSNPNHIQCYCPATGQYIASFPSKTKTELDDMIQRAEIAQSKWSTSSMERRLRVLTSLREYILSNQEMIASIACRDSGKTKLDASMGEILVTLEKLQWLITHGPSVLKPSRRPGPTNFFMKWYKGAEIRYEPLGVVSAIVSWNYPFHNLWGPIIDSLFTGNAIVMKCSEQVVWSSEIFVQLLRECLIQCGEDPELIQLFYCLPPNLEEDSNEETANYFTSHKAFKSITFIGSQQVSHQILRCAAEAITPVVVELGGKDAFIVLDSVKDLQSISSIILRGTFQSSGQNCIGKMCIRDSYY